MLKTKQKNFQITGNQGKYQTTSYDEHLILKIIGYFKNC